MSATAALWLDHGASGLESLSHGELVEFACEQASRIAEQDAVIERQNSQVQAMDAQLSMLMEQFEQQQAELERLRHLVSRNSSNSSMPPSGR